MNEKNAHSIQTVFVLSIFCLFTVLSLFLVLIGANVYRSIVSQTQSNSETRTLLSYVSNKVHSAGAGEVSLQTVSGVPALVLSSAYNGQEYRTYIYEYNGAVMEQFTRASNRFTPGQGDKITSVSKFSMSQSGQELRLTAAGKDGLGLSLSLSLPEAAKAAPFSTTS